MLKLNGHANGGPFRLQKYFLISGFLVIAVVTFLLSAFLYTGNISALLKNSENYARLLAENLNYNIFTGFYAPLKARGAQMDLQKWDQFGALDSLIKDFTYGLKIRRIKVIDKNRKIAYSTDYDLIGKFEPPNSSIDEAFNGKDKTVIAEEKSPQNRWMDSRLTVTYYPLREVTGNYWMLGGIYGVLEISQDVTDQYIAAQQSVMAIILVSAGLMTFLFVTLTLIVRRGERMLLERGSRQKKLEEQLQQSEKLASIGQMIATVAHEIRNPLGIIKSSAEMLVRKSNPDPSRIRKLCGVILEETTRLSGILTDFLEFARPRSPQLSAVDIRDVIYRVRDNLSEEIKERAITWIDSPIAFDPLVEGDSDLLYQAFLNIAINAFEAMPEGGEFSVDIDQEKETIEIVFTDTGSGIDPTNIQKIFTPFFTTNDMGTGLGLSVVHNIISAHSGAIKVNSPEGAGTAFSLRLPRAISISAQAVG